MQLRAFEPSEIERAVEWLGAPENYRWLDFGLGSRPLPALTFRMMLQREIHCLRAFSSERSADPIGIVGLSDIDPDRTRATLWYVLGEKAWASQGYTTRAVAAMLDLGFGELGLRSVSAWSIEMNVASVRILEANGLQRIGRQRQCHWIDGRLHDRLLFDILALEHLGKDGTRGASFAHPRAGR